MCSLHLPIRRSGCDWIGSTSIASQSHHHLTSASCHRNSHDPKNVRRPVRPVLCSSPLHGFRVIIFTCRYSWSLSRFPPGHQGEKIRHSLARQSKYCRFGRSLRTSSSLNGPTSRSLCLPHSDQSTDSHAYSGKSPLYYQSVLIFAIRAQS